MDIMDVNRLCSATDSGLGIPDPIHPVLGMVLSLEANSRKEINPSGFIDYLLLHSPGVINNLTKFIKILYEEITSEEV
jgi:hypothetical protein